MSKQVTFNKVTTGIFEVLVDGEKTSWHIINGSAGLSGRGQNMYGITKGDGSPKWIGSLQACKKILTYSLNKEVK
jgi:hypothetical protein